MIIHIKTFIIIFFEEFFKLYNQLAIYLLLGFAFAGLLRVFFSDKFIIKHLGKKNCKSIFLASIFGIPLPLCSCGVIPTALALKKQGASKGAIISFLTSTPQTGIDSFIVTSSFLGSLLTFYKIIIALITGIIGGLTYNFLDCKNQSYQSSQQIHINTETSTKITSLKNYLHYSFIELLDSLKKWLILGLVLATFISVIIPSNIQEILEQNQYGIWITYLITLLIATPMYICATSSVPIALSLIMKGFSPGTAIILLLVGPATNAATITILFKELGKKTAFIYLLNIIIASLLFGILFDWLFPNYKITLISSSQLTHEHSSSVYIHYLGSIILSILLIFIFVQNHLQKFKNSFLQILLKNQQNISSQHNISVITLQINGTNCIGCMNKIKNQLTTINGVHNLNIDTQGNCVISICSYCAKKSKNELIKEIQTNILNLGYSYKL